MPARSAGVPPLPCLNSSNCIGQQSKTCRKGAKSEGENLPPETPEEAREKVNELQGHHRRTAALICWTVATLALVYGVERLGFLTLTFAEHVTDPKEAQRRWHSLKTNVLNKRYRGWVKVFERQKSGRIHFHILVVLDKDIRTGCDVEAIRRGDLRTAGAFLRAEWGFWRSITNYDGKHPKHRYATFGRANLQPVKSTAEAISFYIGKYVSKHVDARKDEDKGVRLAEFSQGARIGTTRFAWHTVGRSLWAQKVGKLAGALGAKDMDELRRFLGRRWAKRFAKIILRVELTEYPTLEHALRDGREVNPSMWPELAGATNLVCSPRDSRLSPIEAAAEVIKQLLYTRYEQKE